MATVNIDVQTLRGKYQVSAAANDLDITFTAADATNFNHYVSSGTEFVIVQNSGAAAQKFQIVSEVDTFGRTGDLGDLSTTYEVGVDEIAMYGPIPREAWANASTAKVVLKASTTDIKFAIVRPGI